MSKKYLIGVGHARSEPRRKDYIIEKEYTLKTVFCPIIHKTALAGDNFSKRLTH